MGVTFHGLAVAAAATVSAFASAAAAAAVTADSQAAAAQWRPGHADAVAGGLPVLAGTQHSVAAGGSLAANMADDAVAFRKLLHGCHAGEYASGPHQHDSGLGWNQSAQKFNS